MAGTMFDTIGNGLKNAEKSVGGFLQNTWNNSPAKAIINSPGAKELGNEIGGFFNKPEAVQGANGVYQTPAKTTPGLIKPTTPLKKTTTNNADGSTTSQEYHAPANGSGSGSGTGGSTGLDGGTLNSDGTTTLASGQILDKNGNLISGGKISNTGTGNGSSTNSNPPPTVFSQAQTGLLNRANGQESPQVTAARQALEDTQNKEAGMLSQIGGAGSPQTSGSAAGSAMTDQSLMNSQIGNEQQALTSALTSQGQQITAGQSVQSPMGNTAYALDPTTGQIIQSGGSGGSTPTFPGATGNSMIDNTVYNALKMAATTGTDQANNPGLDAIKALNDPQAISAYWQGVSAINNGSYSPTVQSATAQSGASSAGQLNTDITNLTEGVQQVDAAGGLVTKFMSDFPQINQTVFGMVNSQAQKYLKNIGATGALAEYNSLMGTVNKYATQIVAGGYAGTPTGAEALQQLAQPNDLSLADTQKYLNTVKSDGNTQIGVKKGILNQLGGNTSVQTVKPQPIIPSSPASPNGSLGANPYVQGGIATGAEAWDSIWKGISAIPDIVGSLFLGK